MEIVFERNPVKEALNIRDHGISFATAEEAFADPFQSVSENYFLEGEEREQIIGMTKGLTLLFVVFVDRSVMPRNKPSVSYRPARPRPQKQNL
jgi:uncharacterized DUF497 family protein